MQSGLISAMLSLTLQSVGVRAFYGSSIGNLSISCLIPSGLCRLCTSLETLTLNEGVSQIGPFAFSECTSLIGFTIPKRLTKILEFAFESCSSLSNVRMVANCNLESIEGGCFYGCHNLKFINLSIYDTSYLFQNGALTFHNQSKLMVFIPYSGIKNFIVPNDMEVIGRCAFMGSPTLLRVFFNGNKIKMIEYQAFKDCPNLNLIFIASSNSISLGNQVFDGCPLLRKCGSFSVPQDIKQIFIAQKIPNIAFSDECPMENSCEQIRFSFISIFAFCPFILL
ncbi:surface antigen Bsp, putative [Trichomonas vaginalis G3]|uniref:Surface antigen Bsp, putative n=1 Tax=Trichomonas vaginalis (strain ATCC PRA-98 / G3) TaxID=412133 RepID=A2EVC9_TRIV3|nr:ribonuclease inhibitor domain-containing protein [Trichomonas vaginalis G3]EAY03375.1 surface antigen Bsp, putative [Trichomonas vaginalis G3]KAI5538095.1 ribonuclease inhibitor domain-containing protein [Trichomonas vaginalis G3]|eukprot:XP_001315598.1 surface antigen Bsp [Trichomonas vaginalis G3]